MNPVARRLAVAGALCVLGTIASAKRPMTHEDLWQMRRFGEPAVSPDGRKIAVPVAEPAYEAKDDFVDIWLFNSNGRGAPKRLTTTNLPEAGVVWNPDGRRIAFYHRAEGEFTPQVYVADVAKQDVQRITNSPGGARLPKWSPDGRSIAFVSLFYPGARNDAENLEAEIARRSRKVFARVYDSFPVRYWDWWFDGRRPHLLVQDAKPGATPRDLLAGWALADSPGFAGRMTETIEVFDFAWAPDGRSIVFAATLNRDQSAHSATTSDLFVVGLDGSPPRRLTDDTWSYAEPEFAPDGTWLLVEATPYVEGKVYTAQQLHRFPWPFDAGKMVRLAPDLDRNLSEAHITPDGKDVLFTAEEAGRNRAYSAPANGGPSRSLADSKFGSLSSLVVGGRPGKHVVAAIADSADKPPELAVIRENREVKTVSSLNASRAEDLDLPALEEFWFTSSKGRRIQNFIVRPAGFDPARKYPVFVMIHGGPHAMFRDGFAIRMNYHLIAGSDYVVLLTNYSGSTGFGEEFAQSIHGDPLKTPGEELVEALEAAVARFPFMDGTRVSAGGASYGGHLANWLQATTTRFRCLVSHAGMVNVAAQWGTSDVIYHREVDMDGPVWEQGEIWTSQNPARFADRHATGTGWVTPELISCGEHDFRVPLNNTLETWAYLKRLEIPSRMIIFPDEGHSILKGENSRFWYAEVKAWIDKWTLPVEKPAS